MKLRILIVDDEIKSVEPLQAELKKLPETDVFIVGFDTVDKAIEDHEPHIVVEQGQLSRQFGTQNRPWHRRHLGFQNAESFLKQQVAQYEAALSQSEARLEP